MNPSGIIPIKPEDSNISLYEHQKEAIQKLDEWQKQNSENPAGILVLPIGGGKTLTETYWLMQKILSQGKKIIWIS
jgi:superfamily II DNA or RNA helicase